MVVKTVLKSWGSLGKKTPLNRTSKICPLCGNRAQGRYYRPGTSRGTAGANRSPFSAVPGAVVPLLGAVVPLPGACFQPVFLS